jgi:hypothetical protein
VGSWLRKSSLSLLGLAACVAVVAAAPGALGAVSPTQTRDGYVEAVEPICKRNSEANSRILKGVKGQVKGDRLAPAGKRFVRASAALGKTVSQIDAVPQPAADAAKLTTWIGYLRKEKGYLQKIGGYLKAKNKYQAQKQAVELNRNNNKANNTVISFGFEECKIDSSKFL